MPSFCHPEQGEGQAGMQCVLLQRWQAARGGLRQAIPPAPGAAARCGCRDDEKYVNVRWTHQSALPAGRNNEHRGRAPSPHARIADRSRVTSCSSGGPGQAKAFVISVLFSIISSNEPVLAARPNPFGGVYPPSAVERSQRARHETKRRQRRAGYAANRLGQRTRLAKNPMLRSTRRDFSTSSK
jgi:hypothetical protein